MKIFSLLRTFAARVFRPIALAGAPVPTVVLPASLLSHVVDRTPATLVRSRLAPVLARVVN